MKKYLGATVVILIATAMIFSSFAIAADTDILPMQSSGKVRISMEGSKIKGDLNRDDIIWDNGGTVQGGNLFSSQLDQVYPFVSQVADDFEFAEDMLITDVHWYGGFWGGTAFDPVDFWIYIYADDGTGNKPTGAGMPDPSPTAIWSGFYPGVTGLPLDPNGFYSYEVILNPPFLAIGGDKYWIAIQAVFPFPPQWGWAQTSGTKLHLAVQGFPLIGTPFWTDLAVDMAFYLTGESAQPPIPAICCEGNLIWEEVNAGSTVNGTFKVCNCGEPGSLLNWQFESAPTWPGAVFEIIPDSGTALAEGDCVTITVEVKAPPEKKKTFTGKIKMINSDDPADFCEIDVSLTTPRARTGFNLLQWILQKYPNMFPILRHILA